MRLIPDHYLQIRDLKIYNGKVKDNFKLVALGDLHVSRLVDNRKLDPIKFQLDKEKADYHVFLGDLADTPKELDKSDKRKELRNLIKASANMAPTMIILGSHDYVIEEKDRKYISYNRNYWDEVNKINNVYLLNNDCYKDNNVMFMGYMQTFDYYYKNAEKTHCEDLESFYEDFVNYPELYKNLPKDVVNIGLIHSPEYAKLDKNIDLLKEYDLLIGGHDHDGCIPFGIGNFRRGIISPKKEILPKEVRGFRTLDTGTDMLISGGIVKMHNSSPTILHPFNHLCPMQMDTITFTGEEQETEISKRLIYTKK